MKKKSENKRAFVYSMFLRYFIILISSLGNLWIFYFIFTPLTVYLTYFVLDLIFEASLFGTTIFLGSLAYPIEIIEACVAGSAYFLLLIFNLSVPNINLLKRLKMVGFAFLSFFIVNSIRIISLSMIYILKPEIFNVTHLLSWYLGSVVLVVGIWFIEVKIFKIKDIPFYSDIKSVIKYMK